MDDIQTSHFSLEHSVASPEVYAQLAEAGQEVFVLAVKALMAVAINGYPRTIRSTAARSNQLLRQHGGDAQAAAEAAADTQETYLEEAREYLLRLIPYIGMPASVFYPLWKHLRTLCVVAAVFGHDLHDDMVQARVMYATAGLRSVPRLEGTLEKAVEALWRKLAASFAKKVPVGQIVSKAVDMESHALAAFIDVFSDGPGVAGKQYLEELDPVPDAADFLQLLRDTGIQTLDQVVQSMKDTERSPHWETPDGMLRADL